MNEHEQPEVEESTEEAINNTDISPEESTVSTKTLIEDDEVINEATADASEAAKPHDAPDTSETPASEAQGEELQAKADSIAEAVQSDEPLLPAHFEPIPEEKLVHAKRKRRTLIVVIVILIIVLLGAAAGSIYYYLNYGQNNAHIAQPSNVIEGDEAAVQDRGTTVTVEMPDLVQMFGKTPDEVVAILGPDYVITKTDIVTDAEGTESSGAEGEASEVSPVVANMVTISYTPQEQTSPVGATQVQNIYLGLDEGGKTVEVYFVSSMNLLDYPISSFADLVATRTSFVGSLASAGATVSTEVEYIAPTEEEYTEYVDPEASVKKIKKETVTMKGTLVSEQAPTKFEITYTYDYGASGVEATPDRQPSQRMLYIKLS